MGKMSRLVKEPYRALDLRTTNTEWGAAALQCCRHGLKSPTNFGGHDHVGFVRVTKGDKMLSVNDLSIWAQVYKRSFVIVEAASAKLEGDKSEPGSGWEM